MTLHVGIVGFGRIGAEHAGWIAQTENVRVGRVCDFTPARRDVANSSGLRAVGALDELLSFTPLDAVLISTPTVFHFDNARRVWRPGSM